MAKKNKNKSARPKISISLVLVLVATLILIGILGIKITKMINKPNNNQSTPSPNPIVILYSKDDIFGEIEFKDRQIEPSKIPQELTSEMVKNASLKKMKCMPEQIYLGRSGFRYSILQNDSQFQKKVDLRDEKLFEIISKLQKRLPEEYTLSQFIACLTKEGRYIVKYNGIIESRASAGYSTQNPVAFVAQIYQDGTLQDAAYITLENTFCRTPIQLTTDNYFYMECNSYYGYNGTGEVNERFFYRINMTDLNFKLLSKCTTGANATCE